MLLLLAASFALHPKFASAAGAADTPDETCVALLHAAAGLPEGGADADAGAKNISAARAQAPETAAYAANLMRYQMGYLSTLPDANGILPVPTAQQTLDAINRLLIGRLSFDAEPYARQMRGKQTKVYRTYAQNAHVFIEMSEMVRTHTERAVQACIPALRRDMAMANVEMSAPPAPYNLPDWRSLAALYCVYGTESLELLAATLSVSIYGADDGSATIRLSYGAYDDIASQGTRKQFLLARFARAYLYTVFDEHGAEVITEKRAYDEEYLATVQHPVPGYLIKNGWFDPRDRGMRYHTGTDITAPGGTRIHSVTDGTVRFIGYLPIPGNYVIIEDPYGYEYHYYHMRERTQFVREGDTVSSGDIIGRVGNTGNSAANHLHLTIVSPGGVYLNPYDLFRQAGVTPIKPD